MKKILLAFVLLSMVFSVAAENNIQDEFFGCKLGQSTRSQVEKTMQNLNFEFVSADSLYTTTYYRGHFNIAGIEFQKLMFRYTNDTLNYFSCMEEFGDNAYEYSRKIENNLNQKYGNFEVADSTFFATMLRAAYENSVGTWSRRNNGTVVYLFTTDKDVQCVFALEPEYAVRMDELNNSLKLTLASYDSVNLVKGVGGVRFGDNLYKAQDVLDRKSSNMWVSGNKITCTNTTIGGTIYDFAYFVFYDDLGLQKVILAKNFRLYEKHDAEIQLEAIIKQYKTRYTNFKIHVDEQDSKTYSCGMYEEGYDYPPILIMFTRDSEKYQIAVSYFVYKPDFNNDDEI